MKAPDFLKAGSNVGLCAPARWVTPEQMRNGIDTLRSWGLNVHLGEHLYDRYHQLAGIDAARAADIQAFINNEQIEAIFFARGGYGCARLLPLLNLESMLRKPKWVVGYSDATVFHLALGAMGVASIHGAMPFKFSDAPSVASLRAALFGDDVAYAFAPHEQNIFGAAEGRLVGGNLSIIYSLQATPCALRSDDAILFIEDVGEYLYHIDRMMLNLALSGALKRLRAVVVGGMTDMNDNATPYGKTACEIIREHIAPLGIPLACGFPAGHQNANYALPLGAHVDLTVNENGGALKLVAYAQ